MLPRAPITKMLAGAAIVLGCCLLGAAPAGGPVLREEIDRGIRDGLSAPLQ